MAWITVVICIYDTKALHIMLCCAVILLMLVACIVPASAGVKVGMSALSGGR